MGLHVSLEVEVGELVIAGLELKESRKLGVGGDNSAVGLELETVRLDVLVNLTANLGSGHLGSRGLAKELGKLITDAGGLDKSGWLSVARSSLAGSG